MIILYSIQNLFRNIPYLKINIPYRMWVAPWPNTNILTSV